MKNNNTPKKPKRVTSIVDSDGIRYLSSKGHSVSNIALHYGISSATVKKHIDMVDKGITLSAQEKKKLDNYLEEHTEKFKDKLSVRDQMLDLKKSYNGVIATISTATLQSVESTKMLVSRVHDILSHEELCPRDLLQLTTILEKTTSIFNSTTMNLGIQLAEIAKKEANKHLNEEDSTGVTINIISENILPQDKNEEEDLEDNS